MHGHALSTLLRRAIPSLTGLALCLCGTVGADSVRTTWAYRLPPGATAARSHVVEAGDTVWGLAARYGVPLTLVLSANRLPNPNLIRVGQKLRIPLPTDPRRVAHSWPGSYDENLWTLARVINAEARGETYEGQVAVGAVVLNRVLSPLFPKSVQAVVKEGGAFQCVADGQFGLRPGSTAIAAAEDALMGWDPTHGALFFYNPHRATARWSLARRRVRTIGRHVFTT